MEGLSKGIRKVFGFCGCERCFSVRHRKNEIEKMKIMSRFSCEVENNGSKGGGSLGSWHKWLWRSFECCVLMAVPPLRPEWMACGNHRDGCTVGHIFQVSLLCPALCQLLEDRKQSPHRTSISGSSGPSCSTAFTMPTLNLIHNRLSRR